MARIGRVQVWMDCTCGAEVEVEDADVLERCQDVSCPECGRTLRLFPDVSVEEVSGPTDGSDEDDGD